MTDKEKLNYCIKLLEDIINVPMFTDCSDTYGINFTEEYCKLEEEIANFLLKENTK